MAPSAFEQYTLELINRFRLDPGGAFDRIVRDKAAGTAADPFTTQALSFFGVDLDLLEAELDALSPAAPLAWNGALARAADDHNAAMLAAGAQSHQLPGQPPPGDRAREAGYSYTLLAENVFAYANSAPHAHDAFVVDWGAGPGGMQSPRGHREALIDPRFVEIGVGGLRAPDDAPGGVGRWLVTHELGARGSEGPFLLGTVYRDLDGDRFYTPGEGRGAAAIEVSGRGVAAPPPGGGWAVETGEGRFSVTLRGPAVAGPIEAEIEIRGGNVKLDLRDGAHLLTSADLDLTRGARSVEALGEGDIDLSGKRGFDRLIGNDGDNRLSGEGRRDVLIGHGGDDTLFGGWGADILAGGAGRDVLHGNAGPDRLAGHAGADSLFGGAQADLLLGRMGDDLLVGGFGPDRLSGHAGDDDLRGGPGRDELRGHGGDDILRGGAGPDLLIGYAGADDLRGNGRSDRLEGRQGDDALYGGWGWDLLIGHAGRDLLMGQAGRDRLFGGAGDDRLEGGRRGQRPVDRADRRRFADGRRGQRPAGGPPRGGCPAGGRRLGSADRQCRRRPAGGRDRARPALRRAGARQTGGRAGRRRAARRPGGGSVPVRGGGRQRLDPGLGGGRQDRSARRGAGLRGDLADRPRGGCRLRLRGRDRHRRGRRRDGRAGGCAGVRPGRRGRGGPCPGGVATPCAVGTEGGRKAGRCTQVAPERWRGAGADRGGSFERLRTSGPKGFGVGRAGARHAASEGNARGPGAELAAPRQVPNGRRATGRARRSLMDRDRRDVAEGCADAGRGSALAPLGPAAWEPGAAGAGRGGAHGARSRRGRGGAPHVAGEPEGLGRPWRGGLEPGVRLGP
jgi:hypothetical protein